MTEPLLISSYNSPCGALMLGALGEELVLCDWADGWHRQATENRMKRLLKAPVLEGMSPVIERATKELDEYFAGTRTSFDVPVRLVGTAFQLEVWEALKTIPYGVTDTYGGIAAKIGRPKAVRAVGNAVGANPISVIVPCHRILGTGGAITGYGGGYDAKRLLLRLEKIAFIDTPAARARKEA